MSAKYKTQFAHGNIKTLNRNMDLGNAQAIDQLNYTYSGNQLLVVDDALEANYENYGFKDNGYFEQEEYFYDKNGNLYKDLNKGIIDINYNHFNPARAEIFSVHLIALNAYLKVKNYLSSLYICH